MAKLKADWLKEAKDLGLDVTSKNTVAEIKEAIKKHEKADTSSDKDEEVQEEPKNVLELDKSEAKQVKEELAAEVAELKTEATGKEGSKEKSKKKKKVQKKIVKRDPLAKRGKNYKQILQDVDTVKVYELSEAVSVLPKTSKVNFDPSVEIHVNLNVDPKLADQAIRTTVMLPHGTGKSQRVAVLAKETDQKKAKKAGADVVGEEKLLDQIKAENFDFDILIATPDMMSKLGKLGKVLGPKGLMPNPKSGTVTKNVEKAVKDLKSGKVEFRVDSYGIVHQVVGKLSFGDKKIQENIDALIEAIKDAKPASVKSGYFQSINLSTSMGPSIKVDIQSIS